VVEDISGNIGTYTNAEMEYRTADSTIISIAILDGQLTPSICEFIRIWMIIIAVDSMVVVMDNEYELSCTALTMLSGIICGETLKPNNVIPRAENIYQFLCSHELSSHTYGTKI
jgi:hypothetical protein